MSVTAVPIQIRTALYRLFDAAGSLLYVGISSYPTGRMSMHRSDKRWWGDVAHSTVEWFETRDEAADAEALAIITEGPVHNKRIERIPGPEIPDEERATPRPLAGIAEVAGMLGTTRQYVWQLSKRRDFPEPAYMLSAGHFWWLDDIKAWAERKGYTLTD